MKPVIRLFISGLALVTTVRGSQARRLPYGGYGFVQLHNQGTPRLISRRQNGEKENFMTSRLDVTTGRRVPSLDSRGDDALLGW